MKGMKAPIAILVLFFALGFGFFYFIWSTKNDESRFADQLLEYTDVTTPETNRIEVTYQDHKTEITGWDVQEVYNILNRGDGYYRTKLIFHQEPGKNVIKLKFGNTAEIYMSKDEDEPDKDITIMKYIDKEKNKTKYYTVEDIATFQQILDIVQHKTKE